MKEPGEPESDTGELSTDVALMKRDIHQLKNDFTAIKLQLTTSVETLSHKLDDVARPRPTNWLGIVGICFMALTPVSSVLVLYVRSEVQPLKAQAIFDSRERTWMYENVEKHMSWHDKLEDRLWQKVYGEPVPPFVPPSRRQ